MSRDGLWRWSWLRRETQRDGKITADLLSLTHNQPKMASAPRQLSRELSLRDTTRNQGMEHRDQQSDMGLNLVCEEPTTNTGESVSSLHTVESQFNPRLHSREQSERPNAGNKHSSDRLRFMQCYLFARFNSCLIADKTNVLRRLNLSMASMM